MHKDLKTLYREKVVPSMIKDFGYTNIEQVPKVVKISVNRGLGEAAKKLKRIRGESTRNGSDYGSTTDNQQSTKISGGF